jgi:hypothetical protein
LNAKIQWPLPLKGPLIPVRKHVHGDAVEASVFNVPDPNQLTGHVI